MFGSRFIKGGGVIDYPRIKLLINRAGQFFHADAFPHLAERHHQCLQSLPPDVIDGCRPFLSPHFNLTVELPLKAIVRGFTWTVIPITWRNRRTGEAKAENQEKWAAAICSSASTSGWRIFQRRRFSKNQLIGLLPCNYQKLLTKNWPYPGHGKVGLQCPNRVGASLRHAVGQERSIQTSI